MIKRLALLLLLVLAGAAWAQTVTPGFGTGAGQWAGGDVTATLTAGTNISITGTAAQPLGANLAWTINTTGVPTGSGTANALTYWSSSSALGSLAAMTNGQLAIGSTGASPTIAALTGTANQVVVTNGAGSITLSTPQDISPSSSPAFANVTIGGSSVVTTITESDGLSFSKIGNTYTASLDGAFLEDGAVTVVPLATTATITFSTVKATSQYAVTLGPTSSNVTGFWVNPASKTITNCVLNVTANAVTQTFNYHVGVY